MKRTKITYAQVGDDYETKDPALRLTLKAAFSTLNNLRPKFSAIENTLGGSAFVWEQGNCYMASVLECLGTKNLIADEMRKISGKIYYDIIAQDTVATFVNDLSTVGARPLVINAYWAIEDNTWLQDNERMNDFLRGWKKACDMAGCAWGGGESPTLKGIIKKGTVDLAGSAVGIIEPKERLVNERKISAGDRIILIKSNGLNANGISLARTIAKKLKRGYPTRIPDGRMYGEALLTPSNIYAKLIQKLLDKGINIHYIVNITGHGLRKIMRTRQNLSYLLNSIFEPQEVFQFIQNKAGISNYEMYQTFNMGMDYAIFLTEKDVKKALHIIKSYKFEAIDAGYVTNGPRRVVIKSRNLIYESETYQIR